ncbi:SUGP2 isoform 12, partial [Pan troglodytes]
HEPVRIAYDRPRGRPMSKKKGPGRAQLPGGPDGCPVSHLSRNPRTWTSPSRS